MSETPADVTSEEHEEPQAQPRFPVLAALGENREVIGMIVGAVAALVLLEVLRRATLNRFARSHPVVDAFSQGALHRRR